MIIPTMKSESTCLNSNTPPKTKNSTMTLKQGLKSAVMKICELEYQNRTKTKSSFFGLVEKSKLRNKEAKSIIIQTQSSSKNEKKMLIETLKEEI